MPSKTISGWLVVDWKNETHRTRKSKPSASELGTNELLAKLSVNVSIPEVEVPELAVSIDVPEPQVHAATLEALDEDQLPDWSDAADEIVAENEARILDVDAVDLNRIVNELVTKTQLAVEARPDPMLVHDYIEQRADSIRAEGWS